MPKTGVDEGQNKAQFFSLFRGVLLFGGLSMRTGLYFSGDYGYYFRQLMDILRSLELVDTYKSVDDVFCKRLLRKKERSFSEIFKIEAVCYGKGHLKLDEEVLRPF